MGLGIQTLGKAREERWPARRADRVDGVLRRPRRNHAAVQRRADRRSPRRASSPTSALRLAGRDVYVREGCYLCHSQMIRTLRFETQRYGDVLRWPANSCTTGRSSGDRSARAPISRASAANTPTRGNARTCWRRASSCRESNMPGYPWLDGSADRWRGPAGAHARAAHARRSVQRCRDRAARPTRCRTRPSSMRSSPICKASA